MKADHPAGAPANSKDTLDSLNMQTMYGLDTRWVKSREEYDLYQTTSEHGGSTIARYPLFPGIQLFYQEFCQEHLDYSQIRHDFSDDLITINHCRLGRFEAEFRNGEFIYLGEGDLSVNLPENSPIRHSFPLSHFYGIMLLISVEEASRGIRELEAVIGKTGICLESLRDRLSPGNKFVIFRTAPALDHILTEMYEEQNRSRIFYLKLKVLELLLQLSVSDAVVPEIRPYFYKNHVAAVKAMTEYMVKHIDRHFTLEEMSERFQISLTSMKKCFRGIYGMPVHTYMRRYRMHTAAAMLRQTSLSIADIAERVGYTNPSKFTEAFKRIMEESPVEYRNKSCPDGRKTDFSD